MKRFISLLLCAILLMASSAFAEDATAALQNMYAEAELLMAQGDYTGAADKFESLGAYSDSSQMAMYCKAIAVAETMGMYDVAVDTFAKLGDFRDCPQMVVYYTGRGYEASGDSADASTSSDDELSAAIYSYESAEQSYSALALFKDCLTRYQDCQTKRAVLEAELAAHNAQQEAEEAQRMEEQYQKAVALQESEEYQQAIDLYEALGNYKDSKDRIAACQEAITQAEKEGQYLQAVALENEEQYFEAIDIYTSLGDYKDCQEKVAALKGSLYLQAVDLFLAHDYEAAKAIFQPLGNYTDGSNPSSDIFALWCDRDMSLPEYFETATIYHHDRSFGDRHYAYECILHYTVSEANEFFPLNADDYLDELSGRYIAFGFTSGNGPGSFIMSYLFGEDGSVRSSIFSDVTMLKNSDPNYTYSCENQTVVLTPTDPDKEKLSYGVLKLSDGYYAWFKDEDYSQVPSFFIAEVSDRGGLLHPFSTALPSSEDSSDTAAAPDESTLEESYNAAVQMQSEAQYQDAYDLFISLGDYKDSESRADVCAVNYDLGNYYENLFYVNDSSKTYCFDLYRDKFIVMDSEEIKELLESGKWLMHRNALSGGGVTVDEFSDGLLVRDSGFEQKYKIENDLYITTTKEPNYVEKGNQVPYQMRKIAEGYYAFYRANDDGNFERAMIIAIQADDEGNPAHPFLYDPEQLQAEEMEKRGKKEFTDKDTIKAVQQALNEAGYDCGTPDGVAGKNTAAAISAYQRDNGLTETGTATYELLVSLGL